MAYSMNSTTTVGGLVVIPLVLWDGARMSLPYWMGARILRDPSGSWLATALVAIVLEEFAPSVFPWRIGFWPVVIPIADPRC